jgi:DNA primase
LSKFTPDTIDRVRAAADMVEIVSARTDLRRQGARYTGLCPFHEERSPSFSVHAEEKLYHCFGCGVGGDVFDFVAETENIDFPAAVELLADRYGVEVTREREDPQAEKRRKARTRLTELLDRSAGFYATFLEEAPEAGKARDYLASRGLGDEVLGRFGVGYAPSAWDTLIVRGQRAGYSVAELAAAGLAQQGKTGGMYDRFRKRITFPIRDARGRTVGFGARAMGPDQKPKYLNSAENDLFHKGEVLYGIDLARPAMARTGRAVVVEGYTDVLALHQAGFEETVGVMGTAITEPQLALLSATVDTVVLALDADAAGRKAMLRAQEVAAGRKLSIMVVALPAGEDPAEIATADDGAASFAGMLEGAVDLPEFHVGLILDSVDMGSPQDRDRGLAELAPVLAAIPPGATREDLTRRVSERLAIEPSLVVSRLEQPPTPATGTTAAATPGAGTASVKTPARGLLSRRERLERSMLVMCIARPSEGAGYLARLDRDHLSSPLMARVVEHLSAHLADPMAGLESEDRDVHRLVSAMVVRADPAQVGEGSIRRNFKELELAALEDRIAAAGERNDLELRARLNRERSSLVEEVRRAEA